jgi:ABC-type branched-subunit amino acid transport system substrate-binding protein
LTSLTSAKDPSRVRRLFRAAAVSLVLATGLAGCQGQIRNPIGWATTPKPPPKAETTQAAPPARGEAPIVAAPQVNAPPATGTPAPVIESKPLESEPATPAAPEAPPPAGLRAPPAEAARVALLVPLTGPNAAVGRALLDAAQLALFDFGEDRIALMPRDTQGTPEGAGAAASAVLQEGAQLIIGPLLGAEVQAVAPAARERGVPVLTFSSDRTAAGNGVWLLGFRPEEQVDRIADYARSHGLSRFGALVPDSAFGNAVLTALQRAAQRNGAEVGRAETYPPDLTDATQVARRFAHYDERRSSLAEQRKALEGKEDDISKAALERLKGLEALSVTAVDSVFLPEGGQRLRSIATMLAYYEVDPKKTRFLGTGTWDDPANSAEPALVGGWFVSADPKGVESFRQRFEEAYGRRPLRVASLAFDAIAMAAVLARDGGPQPYSAARLTDPNGFAGYDGLFRLLPDGSNQRGLAVLEVGQRSFRVIDPAPTTFQAATN